MCVCDVKRNKCINRAVTSCQISLFYRIVIRSTPIKVVMNKQAIKLLSSYFFILDGSTNFVAVTKKNNGLKM